MDTLDILKAAVTGKLGSPICVLDSGGMTNHRSSKFLAGYGQGVHYSIHEKNAEESLRRFEELVEQENKFAFFTCSYEFGAELNSIPTIESKEPHFWVCLFDEVIEFDYISRKSVLRSYKERREFNAPQGIELSPGPFGSRHVESNFGKIDYIGAVEKIQNEIKKGYTYQTNLTQKFSLLGDFSAPADIFLALRESHPAAFAALLERRKDHVISISPERFVRIENDPSGRRIESSPIKGTAPRGANELEDRRLRSELMSSSKDRAENVMIVDLIRNDLGRICEYGSVTVSRLFEIETHPTLFHLVSTINGRLREEVRTGDVFSALFPCGSITGCPKISTMKIIQELEKTARGFSMGSIGYCGFDNELDMNVAIRTLTIKTDALEFNVGGGVVIDSIPENEYFESLLKAKAILRELLSEKDFRNFFP